MTADRILDWLALRARMVAVALLTPFLRGRSEEEVAQWLDRLPARRRQGVIGATLGLLFLAALAAGQFGLVGLCLFLLAVVAIVR